MKKTFMLKSVCTALAILKINALLAVERTTPYSYQLKGTDLFLWIALFLVAVLFIAVLLLGEKIGGISNLLKKEGPKEEGDKLRTYLHRLNSQQINRILQYKKRQKMNLPAVIVGALGVSLYLLPSNLLAQQGDTINRSNIFTQGGVIITLILLSIPVILAVFILFMKIGKRLYTINNQARGEEAEEIANLIDQIPLSDIEEELEEQKSALDYRVDQNSLSGKTQAKDNRGILKIDPNAGIQIVSVKKKAVQRPNVDPALSRMVTWYLISATCWLLFGTTVGEYVGIKFVAPDVDAVSWLSFGRLRPVHTNAVFWGWASIAMIGLAYYVVPRVSNTPIFSLKWGWYSLHLINACVLLGTVSLLAGVNNGGGEYREYIWPIMLLFAIALVLTLINFYKTIGRRTTREIYISNWYIVAAIIFTIVIALVAYIPFWQHGLGETIVQGYYMHQGVGMWFMLFTLGLVYYFLPQQLNKPIYSYSLGVLAFWSQILFYTLIGSHHFVFSSIPWWLQTVAIVGSAGMAIPVIAGTTNFLMTFNGAWFKIRDSYTLPFFLVGTIFYFTGSLQGTAEAFRSTNLVWHFTDFTVAHSHLTMYGIICFFLWACIYAIVPRFTGQEAPQISIGAHFWLALIGMMFYTVPLMYGSTLKGLMWIEGKPFIEGVVAMAPHWLWRAIGGSLMWLSHLFFAYNMYRMISIQKKVDVPEEIIKRLEEKKISE
ncbi:cytochrome oxidase subunit I [Sphingobacterium sp. SGG-5]|uniref:cbb3-type cytochrome c oxidase subunit I n=1 Tax=Sphingobacterium sp. SGG-5 TaxID=2710881 RepID=UPI0013EC0585|nr:cbb3-type cytochrome c oxidase subunit I [Sphingobacterium sp. SGG-5]NGM62941.1 cytochrome oxidase subunit I [Sphingobacterium sp. SGG-5]